MISFKNQFTTAAEHGYMLKVRWHDFIDQHVFHVNNTDILFDIAFIPLK